MRRKRKRALSTNSPNKKKPIPNRKRKRSISNAGKSVNPKLKKKKKDPIQVCKDAGYKWDGSKFKPKHKRNPDTSNCGAIHLNIEKYLHKLLPKYGLKAPSNLKDVTPNMIWILLMHPVIEHYLGKL